jgi:hypothetical protein
MPFLVDHKGRKYLVVATTEASGHRAIFQAVEMKAGSFIGAKFEELHVEDCTFFGISPVPVMMNVAPQQPQQAAQPHLLRPI